ncbi:hypothetical protein FQN51_004734 [Onygenales sp. PD_10]|nr:hypothetical protein FQN51_004734 [Onygenales sp. PD_10]
MWLTSLALDYGAPVFLVLSPLTSYSDQIYSIHRTKTSAGFSLDIPLIMLLASILKYWTFISYFSLALLVIHIFLPPISHSESYISLLGFAGLGIEAFLPVPQIISNQRAQSCKGFRLSVLASWILGDAMKMGYFFFSGDAVPWAFRVCGILQCCCDCYLGVQYWMFGEGVSRPVERGDSWGMKDADVRLS